VHGLLHRFVGVVGVVACALTYKTAWM